MTTDFEECATVYESVAEGALRFPDRLALICGARSLSYAGLAAAIAAVAQGLRAEGLAAGDRVGVQTNDPIDHVVGLLASMAAGGIAVPLPSDAPTTYADIVGDAAPRFILTCDGPDLAEPVQVDAPCLSLRQLAESVGNPDLLRRRPGAEEIAMIYYTSGTTSGVRKGVMQSYRALYTTARYITRIMQLESSVCEFVGSPTDNAFWFGRIRVLFHNHGTAVVNEGVLNPLRVMAALARHECNSLSGDTPIFVMLLRHMEKRLQAIGGQFKWAKVASQAMAVDDKRRLAELMPNARVVMNYGLTEAMRCCILPFADFPEKLDTVGRPCDTVEARIVSLDGVVLPAGEIGELQVRGGNLASGYWRKDDMWRERVASGWYATGDIASIDAEGFVTIKGRKDEAVNVGGRTIAPAEVEKLLQPMLHNPVNAICGMTDPDGLLGDVLCLCVEGEWREAMAWKEFRIHLFETMPPSLVPKYAMVIADLPRTSNGKIQRNKLRASLEAGQGRRL